MARKRVDGVGIGGGKVADLDLGVGPTRDKPTIGAVDGKGINAACIGVDAAIDFSCGGVPQKDLSIGSARSDDLALGVDGGGKDRGVVVGCAPKQLACVDLPKDHALVLAARHHVFAVCADADAVDDIGVTARIAA